MKKYGILAVVTLLAISGILAAERWSEKEVAAVELYTMQPQAVEQTVVCTGTVESADSRNLYLDTPCIAGQVFFSAGQKVNKGDVLFTVDVDATKDALAAVGSSGLGGISGEALEGLIQKEVTAPVTGVLTALNIKTGTLSDSAKPCAVISSSESLQIKVAVREKDLKSIAIGQSVQVSGTACPMWVSLVENNESQDEGADYFIRKYINQLLSKDPQIDTVILGCTHFPILLPKIRQYIPEHISVIAQGEYVAESLKDYLKRHPEMDAKCTKNGNCQFYTTEAEEKFSESASTFLKQQISVKHITLE